MCPTKQICIASIKTSSIFSVKKHCTLTNLKSLIQSMVKSPCKVSDQAALQDITVIHTENWNYDNLEKWQRKGQRSNFQSFGCILLKYFGLLLLYLAPDLASYNSSSQLSKASASAICCTRFPAKECRSRFTSGMWSYSDIQIQQMYTKSQTGW